MWHDMFTEQIPVAEKIIRTVLIYVLIAVLLRATGKRGLSGLNSLDIVVMVLLSNVVQNAVIGPDNSVLGGAIGAVTLVAVNSALNRAAMRSHWISKIFDGTDTTVIEDGKVIKKAARRIGLRRHELAHAVRLQNGDSIRDVAKGTFDPGGQLIITLKATEQSATKGDIDRLTAQLERIEARLAAS
ncbi:MAG: DUF421 domain-containing protein [Pseudonocardiales bacterium]|nr:MAG: DUF421 domain-containing protein [Pseudonocardiales bacterium]